MTEIYTELLQENSELEAKILRLEKENKQMKSALEEIRNIAEELCEQKNCEEDTHRYSCHYEDVKNILTKINEALK